MATLTQIIKIHYHSHFSVGGAGASDEACLISKTAGIYTHLQPIEFRVKQHKRVWPAQEDKRGKVSAWKRLSNGTLLDFGSRQKQEQNRSTEGRILTS